MVKTNAPLIFKSGFEIGDNEWSDNNGGTVQTTNVHHGTHSYQTNCGSLVWDATWKVFDESHDPIYAQTMFKVTQMHTGTEDPYTFFLFSLPSMYWYTEGFGVSLDLDSATYGDSDWRIRFFYYNETTGFHYTLVGVLLTGIWYKWQIAGHRSTNQSIADGWFKMWQNNALVVQINNVVTSSREYDSVEVGHIAFWGGTMGTNATMYFDCVQVWDNVITDGFALSLNVLSEPPTSVSFEVNGASQTTPYNTQTTGSYFLSAEPIILTNETVYYPDEAEELLPSRLY